MRYMRVICHKLKSNVLQNRQVTIVTIQNYGKVYEVEGNVSFIWAAEEMESLSKAKRSPKFLIAIQSPMSRGFIFQKIKKMEKNNLFTRRRGCRNETA